MFISTMTITKFEFRVFPNTLDVSSFVMGNFDISNTRWYMMLNFFEQDIDLAKKWKDSTIGYFKSFVVPIFHSNKLMLIADAGMRHCCLEDFIMDGKTIEETLALNQAFDIPCKVYCNDEAFGIKKSDYWDGEIGPIFLFNL